MDAFLRKTGRTPYICDRVHALVGEGLALPQGVMAEGKRALIRSLTEKREKAPQRRTSRIPPPAEGARRQGSPALIFETLSAEQLTEELAELRPDYLYVPAELIAAEGGRLEPFIRRGVPIAAVLPRVIHDRELAGAAALLKSARALGVNEALVSNLGHVALCRLAGMEARGDFGLNIFNSYALELARDAMLRSATASFELRLEQIAEMTMAAGRGAHRLRQAAGDAHRAVHHKTERAALRVLHALPALRRARRGDAGAARGRMPQRGVLRQQGVFGRPGGGAGQGRRVGAEAAVHQREPPGVRGGGQGLFGREPLQTQRVHAPGCM